MGAIVSIHHGDTYICCFGFCQQLTRATDVSDQFFDLPLSSKRRCAQVENQGYVDSEQELYEAD